MVSFIIVGQPVMTRLLVVLYHDPTANIVNQGLIVILGQ
jgi:hypothetical protein